jgi:hypothetical protein
MSDMRVSRRRRASFRQAADANAGCQPVSGAFPVRDGAKPHAMGVGARATRQIESVSTGIDDAHDQTE